MTKVELLETATAFLQENLEAGDVDMTQTFMFVEQRNGNVVEQRGRDTKVLLGIVLKQCTDLLLRPEQPVQAVTCHQRTQEDRYWVVGTLPILPYPVWETSLAPPLPEGGFDWTQMIPMDQV